MLIKILTVISILTTMLLLKRPVSIFPPLMACLARSKECFNLDASVKLSRDRNLLACAMILPFCLIVNRFNLHKAGTLLTLPDDIQLLIIIGVILFYILFRETVYRLFRPYRMPKKAYTTAGTTAHTFFVILTLALLAIGGITTVLGMDAEVVTTAMLWISIGIYILFLIRKFQIFISSCSVFAAFLYLCALEIIPTGTLVVSAIIF